MIFIVSIVASYVIGSFPTALLYSRFMHGLDIRKIGDGNMGARNTKRQFGWRAGILVALADILKGALAILLARQFTLPLEWQLTCGAAVILGHDFPVFARFKGGQGFATTSGVFLGLFPLITLISALIYFVLFFAFRNSDLAASLGMLFVTGANIWIGSPLISIGFIFLALLFIPTKKWLDRSRMTPQ